MNIIGLFSTTMTWSACKAIEFGEKMQYMGCYAVEGHPTSSTQVPIESLYATSYPSLHGNTGLFQESTRNSTFGGAAAEKPLNRLKQNLARVIRSWTPLSTSNGMSTGWRGWPPWRGEMLMVCAYYLYFSAARVQTAGPILTSISYSVFLQLLHSFGVRTMASQF